jgi:hypothetical protein
MGQSSAESRFGCEIVTAAARLGFPLPFLCSVLLIVKDPQQYDGRPAQCPFFSVTIVPPASDRRARSPLFPRRQNPRRQCSRPNNRNAGTGRPLHRDLPPRIHRGVILARESKNIGKFQNQRVIINSSESSQAADRPHIRIRNCSQIKKN